jgi:hypothetical protein
MGSARLGESHNRKRRLGPHAKCALIGYRIESRTLRFRPVMQCSFAAGCTLTRAHDSHPMLH